MKRFTTLLTVAALSSTPAAATIPEDVAAMLNTNVDPCENFYQYACGSWLATHDMEPTDVSISYSFDRAEDQIRESVKELAAAASEDENSLVGALWASCMDMDARNALGAEPLQDALASIMEAQSKHELFVVAGRLARTGADLLVNLAPLPRLDNSSQHILWVTTADLTLDAAYYAIPEILAEIEDDLRIYASTLLNLTGFSLDDSSDSKDDDFGEVVLGMEKQLIELQSYATLDPATDDGYYLVSYADAADNYPLIFGAFAEGMQLLGDAPGLGEDSEVALISLAYLDKAEEQVAQLELDDLKTYVAFSLANRFAENLDEHFMTAHFEMFNVALLGSEQAQPLEYRCANDIISLLPAHTGAAYVADREGMEKTDTAFMDMTQWLRDAMKHNIETLDWLDDDTRVGALTKLEAIEIMHSQPDHRQLDKETGGMVKLDPSNYFANVDAIGLTRYMQLASSIGQLVDRGEWILSAAEVNAYYARQSNRVVFPAGMIQSPFFDVDGQTVQRFGALGVVAAHEFTHAFDNIGATFDAQGNYKQWWTNATAAEFYVRTQCLVEQYSAMNITGEDGTELAPVDGNMTLSENIADNGGLHIAYEAYKNFATESASRSGSDSFEADQLFFLSYAQTWCTKLRDETAVYSLLTDVHSVGEARVNGAIMNTAAFATAYSCSSDTPMNPTNKCLLW